MISNLLIKYEKLLCKLNAIIFIFQELIIEYLPIFIIEFSKLKYRIDTIIQYQNIDFSFCLTESDIKSSEQITELTEYYSFVNQEICKY